jgi:hypothetical protein
MEDSGNLFCIHSRKLLSSHPLSSIFSGITFTLWIMLNQPNSTSQMC